ncbi:MAG TPA: hypothetical protein VK668_04230 [Mucilaginibacter sp.]|nr:hypothetical protein [Mucilaginibacter sp.]
MKKINDLDFGFNDAVNYKKPEYKPILDRFFFRTEEYQNLFKASTYFLIGEKGTGKTAYATYITNNKAYNTIGFINNVGETDYEKFIKLKKDNQLQLSEYTNVWKVLIYLIIAHRIKHAESEKSLFKSTAQFDALQLAIDEYYLNAFSPEIVNALNFVEKTKFSAEIIHKYFKALGENIKEGSFTHSKFQTNLLYIQNHFEKAILSLNLANNYIFFIDGIDIRPNSVSYEDYIECIKGLANATWAVNNEIFPNVKSTGKLKVVLLIRPDIFANLGLQNQNNKIKDNAVLLDWRTNYTDFESSKIFTLSDRFLMAQQDKNYSIGSCWDYYFPYTLATYNKKLQKQDSSFIQFLRYSLYRPRDIVTMLDFVKAVHIRNPKNNLNQFTKNDFDNGEFQTNYSDYLMGEIKDYLSFYYSETDYESFRKCFDFLEGKSNFDYNTFLNAYQKMEEYFRNNNINEPKFFETADSFLQFLFDLNVICYIEIIKGKPYIHWCFKERNYANLSPKVKTGCRYEIHYGLLKSLNFGKRSFGRL